MKTIHLKDLYQYEYNICDITLKDSFEEGGIYNCTQSGRMASGFMFFYDMDITHTFKDETKKFQKNDLCYFPKGLKYKSRFSNCLPKRSAVIINFNLIDSFGEDIIFSDNYILISEILKRNFTEYIDELYELISSNKPSALIKAKMYEFLTDMSISSGRQLVPEKYRKVLTAISYIEKNYHKNITVKDVAENSLISETHLRRLFKEYTGNSPLSYINKLKINKATTMLKNGEHKIYEVASAIGIEDAAYFSWFYKNKTGISPKDVL